jgi:hypothetical protein
MDDKGEPPSTCRAKSFRIGRNSRGNWVVQDQSGLCGGLFVDRAEALKFAMFENGNRPQAALDRRPACSARARRLVNHNGPSHEPDPNHSGRRTHRRADYRAGALLQTRKNHRDRRQQRRGRDRSASSGLRSRNDYVELRPPGRAIRRGSPRWTATFDQSDRDDARLGGGLPESHGRADRLARPAAACHRSTASHRAGKPRLSDRGGHRA